MTENVWTNMQIPLQKYRNWKTRYQQEKAELEGMKQEQETEQANLQAAIDSKRASSADCDNEIVYAQQMANEYAALIQEQQAEIEQIVAEKEAAARAEAERMRQSRLRQKQRLKKQRKNRKTAQMNMKKMKTTGRMMKSRKVMTTSMMRNQVERTKSQLTLVKMRILQAKAMT